MGTGIIRNIQKRTGMKGRDKMQYAKPLLKMGIILRKKAGRRHGIWYNKVRTHTESNGKKN